MTQHIHYSVFPIYIHTRKQASSSCAFLPFPIVNMGEGEFFSPCLFTFRPSKSSSHLFNSSVALFRRRLLLLLSSQGERERRTGKIKRQKEEEEEGKLDLYRRKLSRVAASLPFPLFSLFLPCFFPSLPPAPFPLVSGCLPSSFLPFFLRRLSPFLLLSLTLLFFAAFPLPFPPPLGYPDFQKFAKL